MRGRLRARKPERQKTGKRKENDKKGISLFFVVRVPVPRASRCGPNVPKMVHFTRDARRRFS